MRGFTVVSTLPKLAPVWVFTLRMAPEFVRLKTSKSPSSLPFPTDRLYENRRSTRRTVG